MLGAAANAPQYWLTRFYFQRSLAFIYCLGFLILFNQFRGLCGERGLLPARIFIQRVSFWDSPSLFWLGSSDACLLIMATIGLVLALFALTGYSDAFGIWVSAPVWFLLWLIYLSFVNVGQTFYGFGWESLLLETGFLAIFLGPSRSPPPVAIIWLLRWVLFRVMFGAGLIKLRGDPCWRDLTCMQFHYETQPIPNPLSWYFHHLPFWSHRLAVLFTHFVEIPIPFLYFGPRSFRHAAGLITILFQFVLILSGNLSWLNYVTIVLAIACLDDSLLSRIFGSSIFDPSRALEATGMPALVIYGLTSGILLLSIKPALNLISSTQIMNTSFDSLHLVNTYGAFGSITRVRNEVILEGTDDPVITSASKWRAYGFKGKPGDVARRPPQISPYHLRLDWQMWFAAMGPYWQHPWILNLVAKLLQGNPEVLGLIRENPFPEKPPHFIRAELYEYHFTDPGDPSGNWWRRERVATYLPPLSLDQPQFKQILEEQGWAAAQDSK